jgi:hypothetical protein
MFGKPPIETLVESLQSASGFAPEKATADLISLGQIENVRKATAVYVFKKRWPITLIIVAISILLFFIQPILPFMILLVYYAYIQSKIHTQFMQQFAATHNFNYERAGTIDMVKGRLFKVGHSHTLSHVISGAYSSHPMKLFNFNYSVGSGKSKRTYYFTVLEITFDKTIFPHILLQSTTMGKFGFSDYSGEVQDAEINLENNFSDNFKLYATKGYEIEVLQIFTKEVLEFLGQKSSKYSIEFAENRMYIYDDLIVTKNPQLNELLEVTQKIFDLIGPLCNRLEDDFRALHPYYKDKE